ncbi:MAG: hypothetical protein IPP96_18030 [Chitinophagaceae bacterium]|nr:hypothetical protein [Chitinophagaceae bacterium]
MRKSLLLLAAVCASATAFSQDFSNKGKDFWVGYGNHCDMYNGNGTLNATGGAQEMVLYFATEAVTTVTVSIPGIGYTQTYSNIAANTIFETPQFPSRGQMMHAWVLKELQAKAFILPVINQLWPMHIYTMEAGPVLHYYFLPTLWVRNIIP